MTIAVLNLAGGRHTIKADAGDNLAFSFSAIAYDTTDWTLEFRFYEMAFGTNCPSGNIISDLTLTDGSGITNTPNTMGGNSIIAIAIPSASTSGRDGKSLWTELVKTNAGAVQTLSKGALELA